MRGNYFTPEQMEELRQRGVTLGAERIREVTAEWPKLIGEVQQEMEKGTDPADPRVQELARRWMGLMQEFSGGNPGIEQTVTSMFQKESAAMQKGGVNPAVFEYADRAIQAARG